MTDRNLILLRGVSGAGKSTVAELFTDAVLMSTDDYFMIPDAEAVLQYQFDANSLVINHKKCQNAVEDVMKATHDFIFESLTPGPLKNTIVVHNTFTKEWEMEAYFVLADKYKYTVHTVVVENRHGSESIHNVPQDRVEAQRERFEVTL